MLAVVQDQEAPPVAQHIDDSLEQADTGPFIDGGGSGDGDDHAGRVGSGQLAEPDGVTRALTDQCRHLDGDARLADPAGTEQRHEALTVELVDDGVDELAPPDEAARESRHLASTGLWRRRPRVVAGWDGDRLRRDRRRCRHLVGDNGVMQLAQGGRGVDPELAGQGPTEAVERRQRIGPPPAAVQSQHEQRLWSFA
jgi:hypothetical protein